MKWPDAKVEIILQEVLNLMLDQNDNGNGVYFQKYHSSYEISKGKFAIELNNNDITQKITINDLRGEFDLSILPWKQRKIKKSIKMMKYLVEHARELEVDRKQNEAIMKAFPSVVDDAFEKQVLK